MRVPAPALVMPPVPTIAALMTMLFDAALIVLVILLVIAARLIVCVFAELFVIPPMSLTALPLRTKAAALVEKSNALIVRLLTVLSLVGLATPAKTKVLVEPDAGAAPLVQLLIEFQFKLPPPPSQVNVDCALAVVPMARKDMTTTANSGRIAGAPAAKNLTLFIIFGVLIVGLHGAKLFPHPVCAANNREHDRSEIFQHDYLTRERSQIWQLISSKKTGP